MHGNTEEPETRLVDVETARAARVSIVTMLLTVGFIVGYTGWLMLRPGVSQHCAVCGLPLHARTRTVRLLDGKREIVCCPICALNRRRAAGHAVKVVSLTDYDTKSELAPDRAYVVEGSSLHPCGARSMPGSLSQQSASKHSVPCEPSILAFASREDAAKFSRERGGSVLRFEELAAQFPH